MTIIGYSHGNHFLLWLKPWRQAWCQHLLLSICAVTVCGVSFQAFAIGLLSPYLYSHWLKMTLCSTVLEKDGFWWFVVSWDTIMRTICFILLYIENVCSDTDSSFIADSTCIFVTKNVRPIQYYNHSRSLLWYNLDYLVWISILE